MLPNFFRFLSNSAGHDRIELQSGGEFPENGAVKIVFYFEA